VDAFVRTAEPDDVRAVLAVWRRADAEPSVTDDARSVRRLLENDAQSLLVAEMEGAIVGTIIAAWDGWRGNLYRLAVVPEHRRRGIGRALVRRAEVGLRDRGALRLTAIAVEDDGHATGFWDAAGYERQSRRLRFVKNCAS
jgi:ribosomal protein S18 acetylase RimI-like enzyme